MERESSAERGGEEEGGEERGGSPITFTCALGNTCPYGQRSRFAVTRVGVAQSVAGTCRTCA